jgi:hypothetical protein
LWSRTHPQGTKIGVDRARARGAWGLREARILVLRPENLTGARTPRGGFPMERTSPERRISLTEMPLWSWFEAALLFTLSALLCASGALGEDVLDEAAGGDHHVVAVGEVDDLLECLPRH